jgi:predicted GNAT family acetyltransferase
MPADLSPSADVRVVDQPDQGRFAIYVGDELAGFTLYDQHADVYALMHTETRPGFEHQGLASRLIRATLDDLAARDLDVLPYCPFVRSFISRHREYAVMVPAADRARFDLA